MSENFKSPRITINEKYSPIDESARTAGDSVALVDFATKGPIGEVGTFSSLTNFENAFGTPQENHLFSHILAKRVLSLDVPSSINFLRIADDSATKASAVVYNEVIAAAKAYIKPYKDKINNTACLKGFLIPKAGLGDDLTAKITITTNDEVETSTEAFSFSNVFSEDDTKYIISFDTLINEFNKNSNLTSLFSISKLYKDDYTLLVLEAKNIETEILGIKIQKVDSNTDFDFDIFATEDAVTPVAGIEPSTVIDGVFDASGCYLTIESKYAGSGYNNYSIIKSTETDYVGAEAHLLKIKDPVYSAYVEEYSASTVESLISAVNESSNYINIVESAGTTEDNLEFVNGIYVLGSGQKIENSFVEIVSLPAVKGTDGIPEDFEDIKLLYINALKNENLNNTDLYDFSIVATPGCGETSVQDAAIALCVERGDCEYLVDVPLNYVEAKSSGISAAVKWINGDRGGAINSSYAAAYYGWFPVSTTYSPTPTLCPASVFIASKMIEIDYSQGPFYVPAGVKNGRLLVTDYTYSPNSAERDNLCYNGSINPIIFSNTRGVMILSQRTCDRSSSPFNRISSRRMTNKIKKELRIALENVLFMANSSDTRAYTSSLIYDIMDKYKNAGKIESYNLDVSSGTGSNRNSLYINLSFIPYGLVENIVVNLEISDSIVTVTEA